MSIRLGLILVAMATPVVAQAEIRIPTTRQPAGKGRELQVRDVRELIGHLSRIGLEPGTGELEPLPEGLPTAQVLARAVRTFASPPLARGEDARMLGEHFLVSVGSAEQQGWIDGFLRHQSAEAGSRILVAMDVYSVDAVTFQKLGLKHGGRSCNAEEGKALARELDNPGIAKKAAPRLISLPWQACQIMVGEQIGYVRDVQVGVDAAGKRSVDEVWEPLFHGIRFPVWTVNLGDKRIGLLGEVEITNAIRPFPKKEIEVGPAGRKVEIEIPTFTRSTGEIGVAVPDGGYALVTCPPVGGRIPLVLIRLRSGL